MSRCIVQEMKRCDNCRLCGCVGAEWMLDKLVMKQRELGLVGINVRFKKVGRNDHIWDTNCLERESAEWFTWTGILMSPAVRI